ncbi:MAG TPA: SMP-30/gluconolactonase/LRE family protein [Candidatus Binatia bacterium]|jgi:sugar lactone lactonase YvrE|nr:SMP-30/gluconolactonase/LRE family protein [Candidatus Binatia bacterium]
MKARSFTCAVFLFLAVFTLSSVSAADKDDKGNKHQFPQDATFTTLVTLPRPVEGLTGDGVANLYIGGSGATPCPIWQINIHKPSLTVVGNVPTNIGAITIASCAFTGIAFDAAGNLYQADGTAGRIYRILKPNSASPPDATIFAQGAPGTNGLAFDEDGNLWTSDGVTGQGRVWKITGPEADCTLGAEKNCIEVFRIQPMANEVNLVSGVGGVGRDVRALPPGVILVTPTTRNAALNTVCPAPFTTPCALGSQPLVANGLAFNKKGDLFNIDTARGALWKVEFDRHGDLKSPTGCDTTFTANTLCLSNVFVAHPILEGGDGIALDKEGNIWVDANERNAVAVVTKDGEVFEIFRNPVNLPNPVGFGVGLRNAGDQSVGNNHILEFPTSPFLTGKLFCTSMSDGNRRDNSPNTGGEIVPGTAILGKISCMDQELKIPGLPLPVH